MKTRNLLLGVLLTSLAFGVQAKIQRVDYAAYAGEPIREFKYAQLYNWQRHNDRQMVVWTKPSTAYLLSFRSHCDILTGQMTVEIGGVDGISHRVRAGDHVSVGQMRCKIDTIRPLDMGRMKAERA